MHQVKKTLCARYREFQTVGPAPFLVSEETAALVTRAQLWYRPDVNKLFKFHTTMSAQSF